MTRRMLRPVRSVNDYPHAAAQFARKTNKRPTAPQQIAAHLTTDTEGSTVARAGHFDPSRCSCSTLLGSARGKVALAFVRGHARKHRRLTTAAFRTIVPDCLTSLCVDAVENKLVQPLIFDRFEDRRRPIQLLVFNDKGRIWGGVLKGRLHVSVLEFRISYR